MNVKSICGRSIVYRAIHLLLIFSMVKRPRRMNSQVVAALESPMLGMYQHQPFVRLLGLCADYCKNVYEACKAVWLYDGTSPLADVLSQSEFCRQHAIENEDYCYPSGGMLDGPGSAPESGGEECVCLKPIVQLRAPTTGVHHAGKQILVKHDTA